MHTTKISKLNIEDIEINKERILKLTRQENLLKDNSPKDKSPKIIAPKILSSRSNSIHREDKELIIDKED